MSEAFSNLQDTHVVTFYHFKDLKNVILTSVLNKPAVMHKKESEKYDCQVSVWISVEF